MKSTEQKTPIDTLPADIQKLIKATRNQRERYRIEAKKWRDLYEQLKQQVSSKQ